MRALALAFALLLGLMAPPGLSQSADQDALTTFLQDTLSGAGREVRISGFKGALSSQASLDRLTIADDQGIWLTLSDVSLDWSRSDLLSGKLVVTALTAGEIQLDRLPPSQSGAAPEAGSFTLPDLPIAIDIAKLQARRIRLGAAVLGQPVTASLTAALSLQDGSGDLRLELDRLDDGPAGQLHLQAAYDRAADRLDLSLRASEAAGGILAQRLSLPGAPPLGLDLQGQGALTKGGFDADLILTSAGETRLQGKIQGRPGAAGLGLSAALSGDLRPLVAPGLATALGPEQSLRLAGLWLPDGAGFRLDDLSLAGAGFDLAASGQWGDLAGGLTFTGRLQGQLADLAPWSALTGTPLSGAARLDLAGSATLMTGAADLEGGLALSGLGLGQPLFDGLLAGESQADLSLRRDASGVTLRQLRLTAPGLGARLSGRLQSSGPALTGSFTLSDLTRLGPGLAGAVEGEVALGGTLAAPSLRLTAQTRGLSLGQTQADLLLAPPGRLAAEITLSDTGARINTADFANSAMDVQASGSFEAGALRLAVTQRIADLATLLPGLPGALETQGQITRDAAGVTLDLALRGPGQFKAQLQGRLAPDLSQADLAMTGSADAAIANDLAAPRSLGGALGFDLRLKGPFALASLSGPVTLTGGRLADPGQGFSLRDIAARFTLAGGAAQLSATAQGALGGTVAAAGQIGLAAPHSTDLALRLSGLRLRDPALYSTSLDGALTLRGPLFSGAILAGALDLGPTELRIPSSGFASDATLPGLRHRGEAAASRATRARAGLLAGQGAGQGARSAAAALGLDLRLNAPNQVFLRGRGLDAELGGALRLSGTTAEVLPVGALNLIRGRLEILGRRFDLSEAQLQLQGRVLPYIRIAAGVDSGGIATEVRIEGPLDDPEVRFASTPDLPQEEVLAHLLFDRGLESLTVFQAVQLASAVATLAGRGGSGVIDRLRGRSGVDNLDIRTDATGETAVTAGKYLTDRAYTEVTVGQGGSSSISINIDLAPQVTLKGTLEEGGDSGIGLFLQRDY